MEAKKFISKVLPDGHLSLPDDTAKDVGKIFEVILRAYPCWMKYYWRVFRAKGETARLAISDWKSEKEPGGPVGQEVMYNFIEVQPYFAE